MIEPQETQRRLDPQLARRAEYLAEAGRWNEIEAERLEHCLPRRLNRQYQRFKTSLTQSFDRAEQWRKRKRKK